MALRRMTERQQTFFGWKVAWFAFAVAVFSWGVGFYGPSVFLHTLHADRGWSISSISAAITTHFLLSAAMVVYLPDAHRRFGLAWITLTGVGFSVVGMLAWANSQYPWQLYVAALVSGAGWAATSGAAINAMVAPWFDRDRPRALSIAYNGASVGRRRICAALGGAYCADWLRRRSSPSSARSWQSCLRLSCFD